jgi:hypothetical protein
MSSSRFQYAIPSVQDQTPIKARNRRPEQLDFRMYIPVICTEGRSARLRAPPPIPGLTRSGGMNPVEIVLNLATLDQKFCRLENIMTPWEIHGFELANCNCDTGCPCQFMSLPTKGSCEAAVAFIIEKGITGMSICPV